MRCPMIVIIALKLLMKARVIMILMKLGTPATNVRILTEMTMVTQALLRVSARRTTAQISIIRCKPILMEMELEIFAMNVLALMIMRIQIMMAYPTVATTVPQQKMRINLMQILI